jgi:predicted PurR-regulated permease PerM
MFKLLKKGEKDMRVEVTVSTQTVLRVLVLVFAAIIAVAALKQAMSALFLIGAAFFLTLALNGPVQALARRLPGRLRGKRSVATTISFLVVVLAFSVFIATTVPVLVRQTEAFINSVPGFVSDMQREDSEIGKFIQKYRLEGQIEDFTNDLQDRARSISASAFRTLGKIGASIFALLTVLVLTFMMLIEGPRILRFFRELIPRSKRVHADRLASDMYRVVRGYVNGQVTLAALAALIILPMMFILGISYPIALMVVVFICGLIPMVGHTIGAIIVTLIALFTSPFAAITILAYYILYQQIENYLIQPRIQANSTDMSPLLVFGSVVIGVTFGGLIGGLFAIPIAGCIRILVLDYLVNHELITPKTAPVIEDEAEKALSDTK